MKALLLITLFLALLACRAKALSDEELAAIRFDQKLNSRVGTNLLFRDESGRSVQLGDYLGRKPVILVLGYYKCPMLCSLVLNGMVQGLSDIPWSIGKEFTVIDVSIDPRETPELASAKKRNYLKRYGRSAAADGWHFLTGDEQSIRTLAGQVGFHYAYDETSRQFAHPSGLILLTPDAKVSGYLFGMSFSARDLDKGLRVAASNRTGSPIRDLLLLCFHYNPLTGRYSASILGIVRILAILTLVGLAGLVAVLLRRERRPPATQPPTPTASLSPSDGERAGVRDSPHNPS
jgi:protein SCO1